MMKWLKWVWVIVVLAALSGCAHSNGDRVGVVAKCSVKGTTCMTHECEIFLGAASTGSTAASVWAFTVRDVDWDAIGVTLQKSMDTGDPVKLTYEQPRWFWSCESDTGYFVYKAALRVTSVQLPTPQAPVQVPTGAGTLNL